MPQSRPELASIHDYYCLPRSVGSASQSIYDIWESGGAFNDSITPSTYVPEYRSHIVLKILMLTAPEAAVLSLGCGNGFVEGDLAAHGCDVRAIDCNAEAVELTRKKGVDARTVDFFDLRPVDTADVSAVYADGLLGHLFDAAGELAPALGKLRDLALRPGTYLVLSNDAPRDAKADFAPHEHVAGFWFIAKDYLHKSLISFGFEPVESYYFPYLRPVSGIRNRTICVARVP
ncbi:class I SAM-dependent methyltransferase [Nonomuraea sp. JJY05]|uniref:class I SAM-dependent methyltransferase n=1 Tax=Nonomuraea sp. JJY05 TaxID=3350255 RepID=UPI00373ECE2C